jgi:hypothetical protein
MSFTIIERDIVGLLNAIDEAGEVPYIIVGGLGSQLNIARALFEDHKLTLRDLSKKSTPYFRPTEDVDLATLVSDKAGEIKDFRNTLINLSDRGYGVSFHKERDKENRFCGKIFYKTGKNSTAKINFDMEEEKGEAKINFNMEETTGVPREYYKQMMERAQTVELPYKGKTTLSVKVIEVNDLIINKLGGYVLGKREKDFQDIVYNLVFNESRIDEGYIINTINTYFREKAEKLLDGYQKLKEQAQNGREAALNLIK